MLGRPLHLANVTTMPTAAVTVVAAADALAASLYTVAVAAVALAAAASTVAAVAFAFAAHPVAAIALVAAISTAAVAAPTLRLHRQHGTELSRLCRDGRRLVRPGRLHGQPLRRLQSFGDFQ